MDFAWEENQISVRELARAILEKEVPPERVRDVERGPEWFDRPLWRTLAEAGLAGLTVPEAQGGMGLGILEACVLLEEIGRVVAPVPALPVQVGALAVARFGTAEQRARVLPGVAAGESVLSVAAAGLVELGGGKGVRAERGGERWALSGEAALAPFAGAAENLVLAAETAAGPRLFLAPTRAAVRLRPSRISTGEQRWDVVLEGAAAEPLGGEDAPAWLRDHLLVALCATQVGVAERALEITSGYVRERIQFGVPIGSFQAVQHRAADAYIDVTALRWVTWRAACKLSRGEDASREAAVAKFWAAEAGTRVTDAAQHLHGGIGVDIDYPIHRYFLWSRVLAFTLGGAAPHLARLGRDLAERGPEEDA